MLSECSFLYAGPKKSKIDRGLSYKVGCKARFTIAQCYSDPELCRVVISKCGISHVEHGKDWQPPASKPYLAKRKVAASSSPVGIVHNQGFVQSMAEEFARKEILNEFGCECSLPQI